MTRDCRIVELDLETFKASLPDIISVRTSAYEEWNGPRSPREQQEEAEAWTRQASARPNPAMLVAERGGETVGYLLACERRSEHFHIWHTGVRRDVQRQGIGRALLRRCEETGRARGYRVVGTTTQNRFKGMLILLLKEGFDIEGVTWIPGATDLRIALRKELA